MSLLFFVKRRHHALVHLNMYEHEDRVAVLGGHMAQVLGFKGPRLLRFELACAFHDVGKLAIPERVLNKPGPLTSDEYSLVKAHPIIGEQILRELKRLDISAMVRSHHERWDGTGYPDGLNGNLIPMESRLISVVDAYDAMVSDRVYRNGISGDKALNELRRCSATQFDPECVYAFEMAIGDL